LLVCYMCMAQLAEWWEEPGVLLASLWSLTGGPGRLVAALLILVNIGFACPITVLTCSTGMHGWWDSFRAVLNGFWVIMGEHDPWDEGDEKKRTCHPLESSGAVLLASLLKIGFALIAKVLILNGLLLAKLVSNYEDNTKDSKSCRALRHANAALEFASRDMGSLPPLLDLISFCWPKERCVVRGGELKQGLFDIEFIPQSGELNDEDLKDSRLLETDCSKGIPPPDGQQQAPGDGRPPKPRAPTMETSSDDRCGHCRSGSCAQCGCRRQFASPGW